jgi:hypothetical protein
MLKKHGEIEVGVRRVCGVKIETPNIPSGLAYLQQCLRHP